MPDFRMVSIALLMVLRKILRSFITALLLPRNCFCLGLDWSMTLTSCSVCLTFRLSEITFDNSSRRCGSLLILSSALAWRSVGFDPLLFFVSQPKQSQLVGDGGLGFSELHRSLFLRQSVAPDQL